ncbi:MAG: ABC transporter [Paracoccus sp. (in: a-proteobacteria)]|uniref:ABC transporter permease n=1 Tax=Paracoccus sp. TaxID=267 RepID=UPI0026DF0CFB|nr:ABC transporter [Paracoccus sp. (in: a-proteobacteria)]MDO5621734.1 ABC transporter [Paracoccus sp. (in: a-proteobacteria)]
MIGSAFITAALIFEVTVHNIRKSDRSPIWGLVQNIVTAMVMVSVFLLLYLALGVRSSPIRGDFILYILSGIFMFLTHTQTVGAVGAGNALDAMTKHQPINTFILIVSSTLAVLYKQTLSLFVILGFYSLAIEPIHIDKPFQAFGMFLLAWFSGVCAGMVFLAAEPWWPKGVGVMKLFYQRGNMIASGKMFVANSLPGFMVALFDWNPLFHIIDQTRGFVFINYNPHNSNLEYPIYVSLTLLMVGLMGEFVTRNAQSLSWSAGR